MQIERLRFSALAVRIAGIFVLTYAIQYVASVLAWTPQKGELLSYITMWAFVGLSLVVALAMIFAPMGIAGALASGTSAGRDAVTLAIRDIELIACFALGLYFLIDAVLALMNLLIARWASESMSMPWVWHPNLIATGITAIVQIAAGLWLLFGAPGLWSIVRWAREPRL